MEGNLFEYLTVYQVQEGSYVMYVVSLFFTFSYSYSYLGTQEYLEKRRYVVPVGCNVL